MQTCLTRVKQKEKSVKQFSSAISDAKRNLEMLLARVRALRRVIRDLKRFRDAGEPWPGEVIRGAGA